MKKKRYDKEILFWQRVIRTIKRGYGCECRTSDIDDLPQVYKTAKDVFHPSRCPSCRAKEVVDWFEEQIKILKEFNGDLDSDTEVV